MDTNEYSLEPDRGLAGQIRAFRRSRGMTQKELADRLGVTQQSVARWEQGSPPRRYMLRVIESLLEEASEPGEPGEADGPGDGGQRSGLADIVGLRPRVRVVQPRGIEDARRAYVQGCLKLLERGERLPNRVLLLLADELGWGDDDG